MFDHKTDFFAAIVGVQGHDAGAQCIQCVIVKEKFRPLIEEHGHAMSATVAGLLIDAPLLLDLRKRLGPGDLPPVGMISTSRHRGHRVSRSITVLADRALQGFVKRTVVRGVHRFLLSGINVAFALAIC